VEEFSWRDEGSKVVRQMRNEGKGGANIMALSVNSRGRGEAGISLEQEKASVALVVGEKKLSGKRKPLRLRDKVKQSARC